MKPLAAVEDIGWSLFVTHMTSTVHMEVSVLYLPPCLLTSHAIHIISRSSTGGRYLHTGGRLLSSVLLPPLCDEPHLQSLKSFSVRLFQSLRIPDPPPSYSGGLQTFHTSLWAADHWQCWCLRALLHTHCVNAP